MGRIVMFNRVSADGYFARADGNLDWVVPEPAIDKAGASSLSNRGTILFGRRTYEMFESFWPYVLDASPAPSGDNTAAVEDAATAADPHDAGRRSPEMRAIAVWINEATKVVFSRTRKEVTWQGSRLLRELNPREIEQMKRQSGEDILIFGSASIVSQLTRYGLIDEYMLAVSPIILGSGRPWLSGVEAGLRLKLHEATTYPSGNVVFRYGAVGEGGTTGTSERTLRNSSSK